MNTVIRACVTVLLLVVVLAGCGPVTPAPTAIPLFATNAPAMVPTDVPTATATTAPTGAQVLANLAYVPDGHDEQRLDLYLPGAGDAPFPVLLAFHGGYEDKSRMANLARYFTDRGYAVATINFRDLPDGSGYPGTVQDAFCAVAWVYANAEPYGLDTSRVAGIGHSLGGTLVAMLAAVDDPSLFMEGCPNPLPASPLLHAAITFTGIFDYPGAAAESAGLRSYAVEYLGVEQDQSPEIWAQASPVTWVNGQEPPFLLIHGGSDDNISPENSSRFATTLEGVGVEAQLVLVPGADHNGIVRSVELYATVEEFLSQVWR